MTDTTSEIRTTEWSSSDPSDRFDVVESATGEVICAVQGANAEGVDRAVRAAQSAFESSWRDVTPRERGRLLLAVSEHLRAHLDELAELETREVGKPLEISRDYDMRVCIDSFAFFGGAADKIHGEFFENGPINSYTTPEPYGVVGGIIPFNWPPIHTAAKAAPALAAGNAVALKPPEQCPLTIMRIVELINEVLPKNLVTVVPGAGPATGAALAGHPLVRKLSFTGSTATGRKVVQAASANITATTLELGGKNPFVVFEDADLDAVLPAAIEAAFYNQGEACTAGSRILVHESLHNEFVERFCSAAAALVVGDGLESTTHVGPMVTAAHRDKVLGDIDTAKREGATIAYQGALPTDGRLANGFFVPPTIVSNVTPQMTIAREEVFGPVVSIQPFATFDEAIDMANSTEYALVAGVFTSSIVTAQRAARQIDAGVVFVNNYNRAFLGTPFGGNRNSGYGREHAVQTLREFQKTKSVRLPSGLGEVPVWSGAKAFRKEEQ